MRAYKKTIDNLVRRGIKAWGLEGWEITWGWDNTINDIAIIDPTLWTERRAHISLNKKEVQCVDYKGLRRTVFHELGHCVVYPIWRSMTDWVDHHIGSGKSRDIYEETINSAENIVIDWIITRVMGL